MSSVKVKGKVKVKIVECNVRVQCYSAVVECTAVAGGSGRVFWLCCYYSNTLKG